MAYMPMPRSEHDEGSFFWNGCRCHGGPLHMAALHGKLEVVKAAIEGKPDKLAIVKSRCTFTTDADEEGSAEAIHMAASRSHASVVQYLLDSRAELDAAVIIAGQPQYDVLHAAVSGEGCGGREEIVEHLLEANAPVTTDADGRSLLHIAFQTGNVPVIELLRRVVDQAPAAPLHSLSQRSFMEKLDSTEELTTTLPPPLSLGIRGGKMKEETLAQLAELNPTSLKIFINECPQCIPSFLDRIATMEEDVDEADMKISAVDIARNLTKDDIAKVLRESPEAALALLKQSTEVPVCENGGWHPLPTRVSFAERHWLEKVMYLFNPQRPFRTYYMPDHTWKFNSIKFESPKWHLDLTDRSFGRPILDAEIRLCHVPNILCAEVFSALCDGNNVENDGIADDDVVRAAVRHVFWNGCVRVDLTTVLLNFWGLGLLILEEFLLFEGEVHDDLAPVTRTGKGGLAMAPSRRLHNAHSKSFGFGLGVFSVDLEGQDEKLPPWIAITWIGAKGLIDLWQEWCQFRGFCEIGRYKDYFALDNLLDMIFSCLPMFLFFNPGNLLVLVAAVFLYWVRLLDCFTSAEYIGLEILPIKKLFSGLVPALTVTFVAFCAFTHAFYIVDGGAKYPLVDIVFESFATLITAAMPPDLAPTELLSPDANMPKLVLCLTAVSFFSVFILNIFIGVMGEIYVKEKERAESTFRMDRAKSCFQYLLRCRILPCSILSWNGGMILMVCAGVIASALQIAAFCNHERYLPLSIPFFICQALIMLGAYQSPESPWAKGHKPQEGARPTNYLWYCKHREPENVDPVVQDVSNSVADMKRKLQKIKEFRAPDRSRGMS